VAGPPASKMSSAHLIFFFGGYFLSGSLPHVFDFKKIFFVKKIVFYESTNQMNEKEQLKYFRRPS